MTADVSQELLHVQDVGSFAVQKPLGQGTDGVIPSGKAVQLF